MTGRLELDGLLGPFQTKPFCESMNVQRETAVTIIFMRLWRLLFSSVALTLTERRMHSGMNTFMLQYGGNESHQHVRGEGAKRRSEFPDIHAVWDLKDSSAPTALVWNQYPAMDKDSSVVQFYSTSSQRGFKGLVLKVGDSFHPL